MKILISDFEEGMEANYDLTISSIKKVIPDAEVDVYVYKNKEDFINVMQQYDALITAFLPMDKSIFKHTPNLKCISVSAVGYNSINLEDAKESGVKVCHIDEYCTEEVAEHAFSLIMALNRNLKHYIKEIDEEYKWQYYSIDGGLNLSSMTLAIFGFGRIGRRLAKLVSGFDMRVLAVDPYITEEQNLEYGAELVSLDYALENADVISNHMNLTEENKDYFNMTKFEKMKKCPLFVNVGRGGTVCEKDLIDALDRGLLRGAGLDVLDNDNPDLKENKLVGRSDVILTPHSAFYSRESLYKLQTISAENLAYVLTNKMNKVKKILV